MNTTETLSFGTTPINQKLEFETTNPSKTMILCSKEEIMSKSILSKIICAAFNCKKGAYIFVGIKKQNLQVIGEQFNDAEIEKIQSILKKIKKDLNPKFQQEQLEAELIPINSKTNLNVLRIKIIPKSAKETYYLKITKKRYLLECFIYTIRAGSIKQIQNHQAYDFMLEKYSQKSSINQEKIIKTQFKVSQKKVIKQNSKIPLKYQNNYILCFFKGKEYLPTLMNMLDSYKISYALKKPFEEMQDDSSLNVWFLSCSQNIQKLLKSEPFRYLSYCKVTNTISIGFFSNSYYVTSLKKKLIKQYASEGESEYFKYICEKGRIIFQQLEHAIFGYVFFVHLGKRVDFQ